jgi:hypothetical protein
VTVLCWWSFHGPALSTTTLVGPDRAPHTPCGPDR